MATPKIDPALLEVIQMEAKKAATQVYEEKATRWGVAEVPTHTHNNVDSLGIPASSVNEVLPLPATTGGVVAASTLGNQGVAQGSSNVGFGYQATGAQASFYTFPVTVIYGNGVGADSAFNGGDAPVGTIIFFENGLTLSGLWVKTSVGWYKFVPDAVL